MAAPLLGSRAGQAGFTLLELVIAITLMGLILVVLYSGLRLGLNGSESGEQRAESTDRLRLVQEFLRRQLAQSMTVYQANDQKEQVVVFAGQPNSIDFVAPLLTHLGQGGLYRVRVGLADGRLQVRWRPYQPDDPNAGAEQQKVLLEGVSKIEWAYFGSERDDDPEPPRWHTEWSSPQRRPSLVRLNLQGQQTWPDLVVALVDGPPR